MGVLLPGFGKEGAKAYHRLLHGKIDATYSACGLELTDIPREQRLRDPKLSNFARELWAQLGDPFSQLRKQIRRLELAARVDADDPVARC